jgi:FecR protein
MQFAVMAVRNKVFAALIVGVLFVISASAQNPDLSQNPAPSPDVQVQNQPQSPQDQAPQNQVPQDQIQMQDQGQDQDQDVMQDQGQDQGPVNPPTLGPRNDQQSPNDNDRPPMSELPPKPSPNVGPSGENPGYGRPTYNGPGSGPNYGGPNGGPPPNYGGPGYGNNSGNRNNNGTSESNGVGRVSLIHGDVSTQRGDSGDWSAAQLNAPLMTGDKISTGDKARAEVQLDYANILRLSEHAQANITNLTRKSIQVQLGHGMANYTVLGNSDADAEIDTPNVAIRTERRASSFRILVTADDHTEVLVRHGEIEITTPQGGTRVGENQFITIRGTGADTQYRIGEAPGRDDWDQWNTDRDRMIRGSVGHSHTNDYYTGTQDLDGNGNWQNVPDYGSAWFPNVAPGWAPYSAGNWVWEPYWGWTWVSAEPWGWAPYHYGRWFQYNGAWGWWPGPVYGYPFYRPLWAPAYVSFFGFGRGFGVGAGFGWGSIGWFPIGPCDFFHPWWGGWGGRFGYTGFRGWERGGFAPLHGGTRFSNVRLAQNDSHFRGATGVDANHFGGRGGTFSRVDHGSLQNAHFATGNLPVAPTRANLSASGRAAAAGTVRNGGGNQRFFSTHGTTTAASGRSFEREQSQVSNAMRQNGVSPVNRGAESRSAENRSAENRSTGNHGVENRGTENRGNEARSNARASEPGIHEAGRTGESAGSRSTADAHGNSNIGAESRGGNSIGSSGREGGGAAGNGGWQKFSPMTPRSSSSAEESARSSSEARSGAGAESRGSYGSSRGYSGSEGRGAEGRGYGGSRPPLNMRQPIATPRSYGNPYGGRGGYPGYGGRAPSYGGGRAPSPGGGRSAPSGGGHSAPSSHGGASSHGGGSHGGGGHGGHR